MRTSCKRRCKRERGSALLVVLWLSAALAAIALSVSTTVRTETDHASTASEGLRAHYLATGSVERAIQWMQWGPGQRRADGSPQFWDSYTSRMYMQYPSGDAVVEMVPESSKLNINTADSQDLLHVIQVVSGDARLAAAIVGGILQWRGPAGGGGANPASGSTFQPRGASFEEIEELLFVPGMTPELFYGNYTSDAQGQLYARGGLRDCLSVWGSRSGPFDINSVSPALMEAMGVPLQGIQSILGRRTVRPFTNNNEIPNGMNMLKIGGTSIFTLRATARLRRPDGVPSDVVRTSAAVIKRWVDVQHQQTPVQVLRFYEDAWSEFGLKPPAASVVSGAVLTGPGFQPGSRPPGLIFPQVLPQ